MEQELFEKYTKTYGKRFTRKQKHKFAKALHEDMTQAGYEKTMIKGSKLIIMKAEDYFYGNRKRMKTVIVVPYDTPERKFWHKVFYFPLDGTKTMNKTLIATYVPIILLYVFILAGLYIGGNFLSAPTMANLMSFLMFVLVIFLIYLMVHGIGNRHNVNRNSSAVAAAVALAKSLDKDERQRIAFLFTDKNKGSFLGARCADEDFVKDGKNPNVICLDCIGKEDTTMIGYNPSNRKLAMEIAKCYPEKGKQIETIKLDESMRVQTAMSYFRKAVVIASGTLDEDHRLYVMGTGTSKDRDADATQITKIINMLQAYIKSQK